MHIPINLSIEPGTEISQSIVHDQRLLGFLFRIYLVN
jgi:hypothetical protein